jgi:hypothetical protein
MKRLSPSKAPDLEGLRSRIVSQTLLSAALSSPPLHPDPASLSEIEKEFEADASRKMQQLLAKADYWRSQGMVSESVVAEMGQSLGPNAGRGEKRDEEEEEKEEQKKEKEEEEEKDAGQQEHAHEHEHEHKTTTLGLGGSRRSAGSNGGTRSLPMEAAQATVRAMQNGEFGLEGGDVHDAGRTRSTRLRAVLDYVDDSMRRSVQELAWLRDRPPGDLRLGRERDVETLRNEIQGLKAENTALRLSQVLSARGRGRDRDRGRDREGEDASLHGRLSDAIDEEQYSTRMVDRAEGEEQSTEEVGRLVSLCLAGDPSGRMAAVEGLMGAVMGGEREAIEAVIGRLLNDTNGSVRTASLVCLASAGAREPDGGWKRMGEVGERIGGDLFLMHYRDCSWGVRRTAIELSRKAYGGPPGQGGGLGGGLEVLVVRGLVQCMADEEWRVRMSACRAAAGYEHPQSLSL